MSCDSFPGLLEVWGRDLSWEGWHPKKGTDFDGRNFFVDRSMSAQENTTRQNLASYSKGSEIPVGSTYDCHDTISGEEVHFARKDFVMIPS